MNAELPPPLAGATVVSTASIVPEPPVDLPRLLFGLAFAVVAFDICFWDVGTMGLSVPVFVLTLAGLILWNREKPRRGKKIGFLLALLAGAALAAVMETGCTNTLVFLTLIVAIAGETFYTGTDSFWGRLLSQGVALIFAPGRIFWLAARLLEVVAKQGMGGVGGLVGRGLLVLPALFLALVFGLLLSTGNAVFGSWTGTFFDWFWKELELYANFWRIVVWGLVAFFALPLLRPSNISPKWWKSTILLSPLPAMIPSRAALFSSGLVLVVLNLMFGVANLADLFFLWSGESLPKGVTYSGFVHNGTNALTVTALLSALVLASIFQQESAVAKNRILKLLGLFWIAQNVFLLMSVALRLKIYIEAYDMTVLRLSVIIFLALVAIGFLLITIKIIQDRTLAWLIGGCVLAVFATFYTAQFLNLGGWSANYNVARWEKDRSKNLDVRYICSLGAAGWPALRRASDEGAAGDVWADYDGYAGKPIELARHNETEHPCARFDLAHWREFSLRAWMNRGALEEERK